jgi:hypothetical protein
MNNKVLCCLICVVVIIILVITIVTHKKENFLTDLDAVGSSYSEDNNYTTPDTINSIISKIDGTLLNVNVLSSDSNTNNNDKTIEILTDNYGSRLCMDDTTNNLSKCDVAKQWKLKIINNSVVMNELNKSSLGQSSKMVNYPFFMVLTPDGNLALQYNNGRFSVAPVGNYDSQKWDVSDYEIPQKQLFVNDIYDGPLDKMHYSQDSDPKDRVKINLNVNQDRLKELLHIDTNTSNDEGTRSKYDRYIPKKAVNNLCSACKV